MSVRVLYNATFARVGGGLSYSLNQLRALADREGIELVVLTSPWNHAAFDDLCSTARNLTTELIGVPNVAARFAWEQTMLPLRARDHDVLVCPGNFGPLLGIRPTLLILQNPNYVGRGRHLKQNDKLRRRLKIGLSHWSMKRADLVVAISHSLSAEIDREASLRGVRRVTIRSGAPQVRVDEPDSVIATRARSLVGEASFVLSVANDYPHKRLSDLARLARVLPTNAELPDKIVFVGDISEERRSELLAVSGPERDRLLFLGSVQEREMVDELYRQAAVAVSTSELEAYPLTPQEAGSLGTRLVVTDIPPHREVTEDNASFFAVGDVSALAAAITESLAVPARPWSIDSSWAFHGDQIEAAIRSLAA